MKTSDIYDLPEPRSYPSPLRGGSAERSGGRGGGSHNGSLARGYPHPTSLRLATLPARGRDKKAQSWRAFTLLALALLFTFVSSVTTASAHPHVWVTSSSELIYAPDGSITGVRHAWTFDDMFTSYALQGIPSKTKGVYSRDELASLAQTNVESLKEFGFFTFAKADSKKQRFLEPVDYYLEYKDAALVLHFTLPFKTPFKTRQLALEIFDPSYFVDFSLQKADPIRLVGAPAGCSFEVQRPTDGTASAQKLNEQTFMNGDNSNFGAMYANKITVNCP